MASAIFVEVGRGTSDTPRNVNFLDMNVIVPLHFASPEVARRNVTDVSCAATVKQNVVDPLCFASHRLLHPM